MSEVEPVRPNEPAQVSQPPGWYPVGVGQLGWWDGSAWTEHRAPVPPQQQQQAYAQGGYAPQAMRQPSMMVTSVPKRTNHTFHLLMTLLTCGLWAPVWIIAAAVNGSTRDKHVTHIS